MRTSRVALLRFTAALMAALLLAMGQSPSSGVGDGQIRGVVTDEGGEPLAAVQVRLWAFEDEFPWSVTFFDATVTDADGAYAFVGLGPESYSLLFYGPEGYTSELYDDVPWSAPPGEGPSENHIRTLDGYSGILVAEGQQVVVDEELLPFAPVSGRVTNALGDPVDGATVYVASPDGQPSTDENGRWTARVHPGEVALGFSHPLYFDTYWPGVTDFLERETLHVPPEGLAGADIVMTRPSSVAGRVVDAAGAGIAGAQVEVSAQLPDGRWEGDLQVTDEDGRYRVTGLEPGSYRVAVSARGYLSRDYGGQPYGFYEPREWVEIEVPEGLQGQGYDVVMRRGAVLDPSVSGPDGAVDPEESSARVCYPEGHPREGSCLQSYQTLTVGGIPPGTYEVAFFSKGLVAECWKDRYAEDCDLVDFRYEERWEPRVRLDRERVIEAERPQLKGVPRVGSALTASIGDVRPGDTRVRYEWLRDGRRIEGADGRRYTVRRVDRQHDLAVKLTLTAQDYRKLVVRSAQLRVR